MQRHNKSTRRSFLKTLAASAASVAAAPSIIPSTAWGKGAVPSPSERITLGHIGVGGRGSALLRGFIQLPDVQYVAIADCFESRRQAISKLINDTYAEKYDQGAYRGCDVHRDFRELLARPDIDAVIVSTPDHWHVPIGIMAARAGKDMYVEKPLGLSLEQDRAMREAVRRYGSVFQYGTQQRSGRDFRHACELVLNGYIGEIKRIDAWCAGGISGGSLAPIPVPADLDYEMWLGPAPARPFTADRCVPNGTYHCYDNALGFIAGWGAHPLDIAQWGLGMDHTCPVEYSGSGTLPTQPGLFNSVVEWDVLCRYASGVEMRFMSANVAQPVIAKYRPPLDHGTTFFGTKGWVSVDRGGFHASDPRLNKVVIPPGGIHLTQSLRHDRNFIDAIKRRALPISPIECAVRSDTISHLSNIVVRTGRPLRYDPEREVILGDEAASRLLTRPMRAPWRLV